MSFDRDTRNKLARMVGDARRRLVADVTDSLRRLGLQDDGTLVPLSALPGLSDADKAASEVPRDLLAHFAAQEAAASEANRAQAAHARLVREIGFTTLNRLVALRMAEERGLIIESVRNGLSAAGFQLFERIANGSLGTRAEAYRAYLECLYDELAVDLPSLFSRMSPESLVFPSEPVLEHVLRLLNDPSLADMWEEDETIGWVYQYYNDSDERKKMRDASQAPRNSRELAVRNQFFTPRYVVEFLTDNTVGRTWYEMRQGDTRLRDECHYLVRRPTEVFLQSGESAPESLEYRADLSQEELLNQPVHVSFRAKKDPRDLKILDPACGSGHFLLYAFDLLETIYEEAWADESSPRSEVTGQTLREDYRDVDVFRRAVPGLVLRHNLYGVDIDPRAVQIAGLALWLRAQRSYQALGLVGAPRPRLIKGNLVVAEPMPGERDLLDQFVPHLDPPLIGGLVKLVFSKMQLAGEAGTLLKLEDELRDAISTAKTVWQRGPKPQQLALMPGDMRQRPEQMLMELDTSRITDKSFWERVEERVFAALRDFAAEATDAEATKKRLFAEDAERGFAFIDLCRQRFDVVLMNPPFGALPRGQVSTYLLKSYPSSKHDLACAFLERWAERLLPSAFLAAITTRTPYFLTYMTSWREELLLYRVRPTQFVDLGDGVLEARIETAAVVLTNDHPALEPTCRFMNVLNTQDKEILLNELVSNSDLTRVFEVPPSHLRMIPSSPFVYQISPDVRALFHNKSFETIETGGCKLGHGAATTDNERFLRLRWEVSPSRIGRNAVWVPISKGGDYSPFLTNHHLLINWEQSGEQIKAYVAALRQSKGWSPHWTAVLNSYDMYFHAGMTWPARPAKRGSFAVLPKDMIFTHSGMALVGAPEEIRPRLAFANSGIFLGLLNLLMPRGTEGTQGLKYELGFIRKVPFPSPASSPGIFKSLTMAANEGIEAASDQLMYDETSCYFERPIGLAQSTGHGATLHDRLGSVAEVWAAQRRRVADALVRVDDIARLAYGLEPESVRQLESSITPHEEAYEDPPSPREVTQGLASSSSSELHG